MKENVERACNSFKTGVIIWISAYFAVYLIGAYINDFSVYNSEIIKLMNIEKFLLQVIISGVMYLVLEVVIVHFINDIIKKVDEEKNVEVFKSAIILLLIIVALFSVLYIVKEVNIISRNILRLMMAIIGIQVIIFAITQIINTAIYNKKLKEKQKIIQ